MWDDGPKSRNQLTHFLGTGNCIPSSCTSGPWAILYTAYDENGRVVCCSFLLVSNYGQIFSKVSFSQNRIW